MGGYELRRGDTADFPDLDPEAQVPFVRLMLEVCLDGKEADARFREKTITATLEMVERIRQEIGKVGFWKNTERREQLTKQLVRDLDESGVCPPGRERALAQKLVALAKENHEYLTRE